MSRCLVLFLVVIASVAVGHPPRSQDARTGGLRRIGRGIIVVWFGSRSCCLLTERGIVFAEKLQTL